MKTLLSVVLVASLAAGGALAAEPQGMERGEYVGYYVLDPTQCGDDELCVEPLYVPCLSAALVGTERVSYWAQEFYSPVTGAYHVIFHRKSEMVLDDGAGNTWLGRGEAFYEGDVWSGDSGQFVGRFTFKPVVGDGPMWKMSANFKITVNAKGEVVVDRGLFETRCLPPKAN